MPFKTFVVWGKRKESDPHLLQAQQVKKIKYRTCVCQSLLPFPIQLHPLFAHIMVGTEVSPPEIFKSNMTINPTKRYVDYNAAGFRSTVQTTPKRSRPVPTSIQISRTPRPLKEMSFKRFLFLALAAILFSVAERF